MPGKPNTGKNIHGVSAVDNCRGDGVVSDAAGDVSGRDIARVAFILILFWMVMGVRIW